MRTWEYITLKLGTTGWLVGGKFDADALNLRLNELGRQGWEMVSAFDTNMHDGRTRDVVVILKRERS